MHTFLVRVWVSADERPWDADLRGVVRHVATGVETPFRSDEEILHLLRQATAQPPRWRTEKGQQPGSLVGSDPTRKKDDR